MSLCVRNSSIGLKLFAHLFSLSISVAPPQSTPPMSPGPMSGPGMRPPYHGGPPGPGMAPGPSVQPPPKKLNPDQMPSVVSIFSRLAFPFFFSAISLFWLV